MLFSDCWYCLPLWIPLILDYVFKLTQRVDITVTELVQESANKDRQYGRSDGKKDRDPANLRAVISGSEKNAQESEQVVIGIAVKGKSPVSDPLQLTQNKQAIACQTDGSREEGRDGGGEVIWFYFQIGWSGKAPPRR